MAAREDLHSITQILRLGAKRHHINPQPARRAKFFDADEAMAVQMSPPAPEADQASWNEGQVSQEHIFDNRNN